MITLLCISNERATVMLVSKALAAKGYSLDIAPTPRQGLRHVRQNPPAGILIDCTVAMGHTTEPCSAEDCRLLRRASDAPLLLLLAPTSDFPELVMAADDFILRPANPGPVWSAELATRLERLRQQALQGRDGTTITFGSLTIDRQARQATRDGRALELCRREFDLLVYLAGQAGNVVSRAELLTAVWGYSCPVPTRSVDVSVHFLRRQLAGSDIAIETVHGVGYRMQGQ